MTSVDVSLDTPFNDSPPNSGKDLEQNEIKAKDKADLKAKRSVFEDNFKPPTGRKQHSRTAVLLFYWEKNDIKVGPEVQDLGRVLKEKYNFELQTFQIRSQEHPSPELQLESTLLQFLANHDGPNTLFIIYYAGHGWIKSGHDHDKDFKLGAQTDFAALEDRERNQLVWGNAEKVLRDRASDILLIFDCCYAGYLRKVYRGVHTFEFLGACDEGEKTFGPGPKSFTKFLIMALEDLAVSGQGFDTRTLLSKIKTYEDFRTTKLNPVLFHRDFRSTAHIWIESVTSDEATRSAPFEAGQPAEQRSDTTTDPEWLEFSFAFNRPQELEDIKKLATSLTDFAADHTSHGLERVTLQAKSPDPRLGGPFLARWLDRVRRKSFLGHRPNPTALAGVAIQVSPDSDTPTAMTPQMAQNESKVQGLATPVSGADGLTSDCSSDRKPVRKHNLSNADGADSDVPKIRRPKKQRSKGK